MQPFDGGVFDKRYDDVFEPAVKEAGFEAYRVDRDPSVSIPISEIEAGIRDAELCLAEITTDNPNVWFELGFAIAVPKEVVLLCSEERTTKFPFDVQHRSIIKYKTESTRDFDELGEKIVERIRALERKALAIDTTAQISPLADSQGLSQHEMVALVTVMENGFLSAEGVSGWRIQQDMNKAGFTDIAVSLALRILVQKGLLTSLEQHDDYSKETFTAYQVTTEGEQWLLQNQDKLILKKTPPAPLPEDSDDLPF
jgi:hypothetical protein